MGGGFANPRFGLNISAGTGLAQTGTVVLSNSNGVSFGMQTSASSFVVTLSTDSGGIHSISAGTTQITSGTLVLSNSNAISFGINGQNATAGLTQVKYWAPQKSNCQIFGDLLFAGSTARNLVFSNALVDFPLAATRLDLLLAVTAGGNRAGSYTMSVGAYTMTGSSAFQVSSASVAVSWDNGGNSTVLTQYGGQSGIRWRSIPLGTWNITPGEYLFGCIVSYSGLITISGFGPLGLVQQQPGGGDNTQYWAPLLVYTTGTSELPSSFQLSNLSGTLQRVTPYLRLIGTA